ncbi:MAG: MBL fold metallo-hydrolase [Peptococcaceae bacterium]|jgi:glyoxylase-like metal-dependent hydrolase (beta-lactamase superfamily II)|nr:MBL fold metallo-hydrolase [Peptococcaceae bacterium]
MSISFKTSSVKTSHSQPLGWQAALPRPQYAAYQKLAVAGDGWYEVYQALPGVYALYESGHFQEVISFLITGQKQALLWDTGMGISPIRPVVEQLTDLPLIVVNSHHHFDHVGSNWAFPQVFAWRTAESVRRASLGYGNAFFLPMLGADSLARPLPTGFAAEEYHISPWRQAAIQPDPADAAGVAAQAAGAGVAAQAAGAGVAAGAAGDVSAGSPGIASAPAASPAAAAPPAAALIPAPAPADLPQATRRLFTGLAFDLGGRRLEILHTPGHTADSVMLLDQANGILFTGDTIYPAALYTHFDDDEYGKSDLHVYAKTMEDLCALAPRLAYLCCSHNLPVCGPDLLTRVAAGFQGIKACPAAAGEAPDADGLLRRDFGDFAIIWRR